MGQTQAKTKHNNEPKSGSTEKHFIQNGGIFLEKQLALIRGRNIGSRQLKTLSINEIEKATNNYDPSLVIGSNLSTVFKGVVEDRVVAIKVPGNQWSFIDLYLTDAVTSMVMNHDNLVKIYGYCLETYVPIMVYEYLPNGSLFEQLHYTSGYIKWSDRLRVAIDTAYALSYMHTALSRPVVHRDVQSRNILLDWSFGAKLSNFGYSLSLTPGETSEKQPVQGTSRYIDPEYVESGEVTEKCDVYSFGVLLLEILTGKEPLMMAVHDTDLVDVFVSAVEKNGMMDMIDRGVLEEAREGEIEEVARVALACVAKKGEERPLMINVVQQLWQTETNVHKKGPLNVCKRQLACLKAGHPKYCWSCHQHWGADFVTSCYNDIASCHEDCLINSNVFR